LFEEIGIGASMRMMAGKWATNCGIDSSSGSEFAMEVVEQQTAQEAGNMDRGARPTIERRTFVMPTISCSDEGAEASNLLMGLEWRRDIGH
jgi:hypothetical protein